MRKLALVTALAAVAIGVAAGAGAFASDDQGKNARAALNGNNEVVGPGSISTVGQGEFRARIDDGAQTITYTLTYTLENTATQAHIHFAQQHVGGGVSAFLCGGSTKPPCPPGTASQATVTGTITPDDVIGPASQGIEAGSWAELVRAMRAGATYANVHSTRWPAGEIRGQVRVGGKGDGKDGSGKKDD
jgi:hypothetical protein